MNRVDFLFASAGVFLRQNQLKEALVLAEAAHLIGGVSPQAVKFLSYVRLKNKDFKGCLELINTLPNTNERVIQLLKGLALFALGNREQSRVAINNYKRASK